MRIWNIVASGQAGKYSGIVAVCDRCGLDVPLFKEPLRARPPSPLDVPQARARPGQ